MIQKLLKDNLMNENSINADRENGQIDCQVMREADKEKRLQRLEKGYRLLSYVLSWRKGNK